MSLNVPLRGKAGESESDEFAPDGSDLRIHSSEETEQTPRRPIARSKSQSRADQAISDAKQGLHSLLKPTREDGNPHVIISSTGAIRNETRGRIAGPGADKTVRPKGAPDNKPYFLGGGTRPANSSLAIVPRSTELVPQHEAQPETKLSVSKAAQSLQAARDRASLLLGTLDPHNELSTDLASQHASRRAASQWVTRYATHLVILVVVGALVAFGGLKTLTAQGYSHSLQAVDAYTGTDYFGQDQGGSAQLDSDSMNYTLTLPRTELGADNAAAAGSNIPVPGQPSKATGEAAAPVRTTVTQYTVASGDSVQSIADKFNVMPETVMGSNGIYDPEEDLKPGQVLNIPPIDGMYYVAQEGDTLDAIARRFQTEPSAILSYGANNISNGTVRAGQAIVVPGGMMPARETTLTYTVRPGDSLKGIAARFGVDVPTMVHSNNIPDPDNLQIGSQLRVLPVPGLEYKVQKGDNINSIADRFGVTPQMILDYSPNHLTLQSTLQIDQVIIVPGGMPEQPKVVAAARIAQSNDQVQAPSQPQQSKPQPRAAAPKAAPKTAPVIQPAPRPQAPAPQPDVSGNITGGPVRGTGHFIWPVNGVITQYFSSHHNGLDLAISAGTPIHASDSGLVVWAGWRTDGLGYCVIIDHLNGYSTVYGHQIRQPAVHVGQYVVQGQVIGWVGSTGHSTGPHVHFMIKGGSATSHNYLNPLAFLGH